MDKLCREQFAKSAWRMKPLLDPFVWIATLVASTLIALGCTTITDNNSEVPSTPHSTSWGVRLSPSLAHAHRSLSDGPGEDWTHSAFPVQVHVESQTGGLSVLARASMIPEAQLNAPSSTKEGNRNSAFRPRRLIRTTRPFDLRVADRPAWIYRSGDQRSDGEFLLRDSIDRLELTMRTDQVTIRIGRQAFSTGRALLLPATEIFYPLGGQMDLSEAQFAADGIVVAGKIGNATDASWLAGLFPGIADQRQPQTPPHSARFVLGVKNYGYNIDFSMYAVSEQKAHWLTGGAGWASGIFSLSFDLLMSYQTHGSSQSLRFDTKDMRFRSVTGMAVAFTGETTMRTEWAWNDPRLTRTVFPEQILAGVAPTSQYPLLSTHLFETRISHSLNVQTVGAYSLRYVPNDSPSATSAGHAEPTRPGGSILQALSWTWDLDDQSTFQAAISQERRDTLNTITGWSGRLTLVTEY
jgi:hypothetical protein